MHVVYVVMGRCAMTLIIHNTHVWSEAYGAICRPLWDAPYLSQSCGQYYCRCMLSLTALETCFACHDVKLHALGAQL